MTALTYSNGPLTGNFGLTDQSNTWLLPQTFNSTVTVNSTATFNSSVDFTGTVTFNNSVTAINSINIHLGDSSGDIIFVNGGLRLYNSGLTNYAKFDMQNLLGNSTFKFPNISGSTIAVVDLAQTWTATQTFSAATGIVVTGTAQFDSAVNLGNASTDIIAANGILVVGGGLDWTGSTATSAGAGIRSLPANPDGFIVMKVSGATRKIPYYLT